jgi:tyrosine-protein phosphatase SIW14
MMARTREKFTRAMLIASLAASLSAAAHAQQVTSSRTSLTAPDHTFGQKLFLSGVPNFGEVSPTLFRGAQPSGEGLDALAKMGIGVVIDLRGDRDSEREQVTKFGMQYVSIPSHCSHMNDDGVAEFLSVLRKNPDKKIFVHCQLGVDRTGMMIAAYRMGEQGWTAEESLREMETFGFSWKHKLMCPGLASFEFGFPSAFANDSAFDNLRASSGTKN